MPLLPPGVGPAADRLRIADDGVRRGYKEQMQQSGLKVASLMMGLLVQGMLDPLVNAAHRVNVELTLRYGPDDFFTQHEVWHVAGRDNDPLLAC